MRYERIGLAVAYILAATIVYFEWKGWVADAIFLWVLYALFIGMIFFLRKTKSKWLLIPGLVAVVVPLVSRIYAAFFLG